VHANGMFRFHPRVDIEYDATCAMPVSPGQKIEGNSVPNSGGGICT
jgi:hypothetical protein